MKNFLITESEKAKILSMHYNAMGKKLVNEANHDPQEFSKAGIQQLTSPSNEDITAGRYNVAFTENTNGRRYNYSCATNPKYGNEIWNKPGAIYDASYKIANDPFVLSQTPEFKKIMAQECRATVNYIAQQNAKNAPQPQVAGATTSKVIAPNPVSDAEVAALEKRRADSTAKREQANIDLKTLMSSPSGFLKYFDSNGELITDKTALEAQVKELNRVLTDGAYITDQTDKQDLLRSMNNLLRNFPEYGEAPYYLKNHITNIKG